MDAPPTRCIACHPGAMNTQTGLDRPDTRYKLEESRRNVRQVDFRKLVTPTLDRPEAHKSEWGERPLPSYAGARSEPDIIVPAAEVT